MLSPIRILSDPILAECDDGCVAVCPCCGNPILTFADAHVTLNPTQLRAMLKTVRGVQYEARRPGVCWGWVLRARTASEDVSFHLTPDETTELADLLGAAVAAVELDALLADVLTRDPL